jgi:prepilin-type N-terminal cleavage/methylation domain-containing protein
MRGRHFADSRTSPSAGVPLLEKQAIRRGRRPAAALGPEIARMLGAMQARTNCSFRALSTSPAGAVIEHREVQTQPAGRLQGGSRVRNKVRSKRGFTLIELMVVLSVLTIVAVIAFVGIRNNQWEGAYLRFTDDLAGSMTQARNRAIDDQTTVRVQVQEDRLEVFWTDPTTKQEVFVWGNYRSKVDGGLLGDRACITGMAPGITPPSQPNDAEMPLACLGGQQNIIFQPDGTFTLPNDPWPDAGMTMVVADLGSSVPEYSIIEMFPGGLVRKFDNIPG